MFIFVFIALFFFVKSISICKGYQTPETDDCYYYGGLWDAIIIGSGSSGLSTAVSLQKDNVTKNPLVLEGKPASTHIPSEVKAMGGCLDTFRLPDYDTYFGEAPIGFHWWSMYEEGWVAASLLETIGEQTLDFIEQPNAYYIFQGYNEDGSDLVVPMETGFLYVVVESRRSDASFLCVKKDGTSYYADDCEKGDYSINSNLENVISTTEKKFADFRKYNQNQKKYQKPDFNDRRYTEDEVTVIPKFALALIAGDPAYEAEVWAFVDYCFALYYGLVEPETANSNDVINSLLTSKIHRRIIKSSVAPLFSIVTEIPFDLDSFIGLMFYQYMSTPFYIRGGPENVKNQFVNEIIENGGEIKIRSKATKFVYDDTYTNLLNFGITGDCPRVFTYSVCIKRCIADYDISDLFDLDRRTPEEMKGFFDEDDLNVLTCIAECYQTKRACVGKKRARGVIVNDDTFYESDLIVSTAGHYQNYKVLTPEDVREEFEYDEHFENLGNTFRNFFLWSIHDGNASANGFPNADVFIFINGSVDDSVYIDKLENPSEEFDEEYLIPYIYMSNSARDLEFVEEYPNKFILNVMFPVSQYVWEEWEDSETHSRSDAYYELKHNYTDYLMRVISKSFPDLVFDENRMAAATPLTQRDYMGYGYHFGAVGTPQFIGKEEGQIPTFYMREVDNILIAGNDQMGGGLPIVINSGRKAAKYAQGKDDEAEAI